jgi:electron transport complex protein RnfC
MRLLPCTLSECVEAEDYAGAEAYDVLACIECGCCAFECPAHRPLTQLMKQGKAKVTLIRRHREAQAKAAKG